MAYSNVLGSVIHLECNVDSPLQPHVHSWPGRQGWEKKEDISPSEPKWHANGLPPLEELLFSLMD